MDGTRLQSLIQRGGAKAAAALGTTYTLRRPTLAINPFSTAPVTTLQAAFSVDPAFRAPSGYDKAVWLAWLDGNQTQVFDYLVGSRTFFIAAMQPLLPILVVECDRIVSVSRPAQVSGVGLQSFAGTTRATGTPLMTGWPASILLGGGARGGRPVAGLPDDVPNGGWTVLLPYLTGVTLRGSDFIADDLGRRFAIADAELTSLGWRLVAIEERT